jgi:tetratricopeptide (TPR) repeat protein
VLLDHMGAYDQAMASFENALKSEPGNDMAQKNLETAKKNKEVVKKRDDNLARAEKDAQAKPDDPQLAYKVARAYAFYGKKESTIQWLNEALKLGFKDLNSIKFDPAFINMRGEREFELLILSK